MKQLKERCCKPLVDTGDGIEPTVLYARNMHAAQDSHYCCCCRCCWWWWWWFLVVVVVVVAVMVVVAMLTFVLLMLMSVLLLLVELAALNTLGRNVDVENTLKLRELPSVEVRAACLRSHVRSAAAPPGLVFYTIACKHCPLPGWRPVASQ